MRWNGILLLIIFIATAQILQACSCDGTYSWCETTAGNSVHNIVRGVPVFADGNGVSVKVLEQIKGLTSDDTIHIPFGESSLCYSGLHAEQIGDTLILALIEVDSSDIYLNNNFKIGDYTFFLCGTYFLDVKNDKVIGRITQFQFSMDYSQFILFSDDCPSENSDFYKLFPNPANNLVKAAIDPEFTNDIKIYNIFGQLIYNDPAPFKSDVFQLNLQQFTAGIYFIQFNTKFSMIMERLVIQ